MYEKQQYLLLNALKEDDVIGALAVNHAIIAGGAIRSVFANEPISDYDLYFRSLDDASNFMRSSSLSNFKLVFQTNVAKTYTKGHLKLQVIIMPSMICDNAIDVINQFDYTVCMGAFDLDTREFVLHEKFLEHIAGREMCYNILGKYPLSSLFRLRKYLKKGYTISGTEVIKLGLAVNNLKMKSYLDLKDQLQGIDTLFLKELTDKLMTPEYAEKEYDFTNFMNMIAQHYENYLEEIF